MLQESSRVAAKRSETVGDMFPDIPDIEDDPVFLRKVPSRADKGDSTEPSKVHEISSRKGPDGYSFQDSKDILEGSSCPLLMTSFHCIYHFYFVFTGGRMTLDTPYSREVVADANKALSDAFLANPSELALRKQEANLRAEIITQTHSLDYILQHRKLLLREWQRVSKLLDINGSALDFIVLDAPPRPDEGPSVPMEDSASEDEEVEIVTGAPVVNSTYSA